VIVCNSIHEESREYFWSLHVKEKAKNRVLMAHYTRGKMGALGYLQFL